MKDKQEMGPVRQDRKSHDLTNVVNSLDMRKIYESQNLTQTQGRLRSSLSIFFLFNLCYSNFLGNVRRVRNTSLKCIVLSVVTVIRTSS